MSQPQLSPISTNKNRLPGHYSHSETLHTGCWTLLEFPYLHLRCTLSVQQLGIAEDHERYFNYMLFHFYVTDQSEITSETDSLSSVLVYPTHSAERTQTIGQQATSLYMELIQRTKAFTKTEKNHIKIIIYFTKFKNRMQMPRYPEAFSLVANMLELITLLLTKPIDSVLFF